MTVSYRAVSAGLAFVLCAAVGTAQDRTGSEITSHVVVQSGSQPVMRPLDPTRLTARSNGVEVPIVRVTPAALLSMVVLVDVSRSVSEAMASFVWDGQGHQSNLRPSGMKPPDSPADLFLRPLLRGLLRNVISTDRIRFGRLSNTPTLDAAFSSERADLERAARWVVSPDAETRHGASPLWDAVDAALTALESELSRRRAILLVTDGLATGNRVGLHAVIERATQADVAVFVIGENWGNPRSGRGWTIRDSTSGPWFMIKGAFVSPFDQLQRLARTTGGVFLADGVDGPPDPERRFDAVMRLLRASHAVTIVSPLLPGETGTLSIVSDDPGVEVHVRDHYRR